MRNGRVLQVGDPEEIYARPATEFVAGFVGLSSILTGTCESGLARTTLGEFPAEGFPDGPVRLAVRPETVKVAPRGAMVATVAKAAFRGDRWLVTLVSNGVELLAYSAEEPAAGEEVSLEIDPAPVPVAADEGEE
jgi:ABC-type Fe3+/spermidine/putrescine transport system ATPase subunit